MAARSASSSAGFCARPDDWARGEGAAGLGYIIFENEGGKLTGKGPIAKFLSEEAMTLLSSR